MTRSEYLEAVFDVTPSKSWVHIQEGLMADINSLVAQELAADSMDEIRELRGFRHGLQFVHDMRDLAVMEKNNADL